MNLLFSKKIYKIFYKFKTKKQRCFFLDFIKIKKNDIVFNEKAVLKTFKKKSSIKKNIFENKVNDNYFVIDNKFYLFKKKEKKNFLKKFFLFFGRRFLLNNFFYYEKKLKGGYEFLRKFKNKKFFLFFNKLLLKKLVFSKKKFFEKKKKSFFLKVDRRFLYLLVNKYKKNFKNLKKMLFNKKIKNFKLKGKFNLKMPYDSKKFFVQNYDLNLFYIQKILNFSLKHLIINNFFLGDFLRKSCFFYGNFFLGFRLNFLVFNLEYTILLLRKSLNFILDSFYFFGRKDSCLLFCNSGYLSSFLYYSFFFEKQSYIVGKWVNGFFTNFKSLKNSLDILEKVREKVHVLRYSSEKKFFKKFEGLKNIFLPFFFLISEVSSKTKNTLSECKFLELPVIGLLDSSTTSYSIAYPIPCNNSSFLSIRCFFILFKRCFFLYKCLLYIKLKRKEFLLFIKIFSFLSVYLEKTLKFFKNKKFTLKERIFINLYRLKKLKKKETLKLKHIIKKYVKKKNYKYVKKSVRYWSRTSTLRKK
jgi:ribosomal protein S2